MEESSITLIDTVVEMKQGGSPSASTPNAE
jgi:hypothetical protein